MATAVTITPDSAPAPPVTITPDKPTGPTIGPREEFASPVPGAKTVHDLAQGLEDWSNMTQEGRAQHPVQAAVGDFARNLKQYLVGGEGGGLNLKTGIATNPVLGMVAGVPEDETINAVREGYQALKIGAKKAVGPLGEMASGTETGRAITQTLSPEMASSSVSTSRG